MSSSITPVPLLDLKLQYQNIQEEIQPVIQRICESQRFIMGPEVEALEKEIAHYCGAEFAVGVSSGTDAILLSLMALEVGPGDEVITTPYTFFATVGCIHRLGARTVFVDIEPKSFNLDATKLEAAISPKTKAIIPVHLFGQCADMGPILDIARRHKIAVIEDAAQAIGAEYHGKRAGGMGITGCFSFFPSKNLGAFGDAGLVTCTDSVLAERLKMLRVHGSKVKYFHEEVGGNFRLDALQAGILRVKMRHLDSWTERRRGNALKYRELFEATGLSRKIEIPLETVGRHVYNQFVVRFQDFSDRTRVMMHLKESQIGCEIYYPLALHEQQCFKSLGYHKGDFPHSEQAAATSLALPIFPELTERQLEIVVERIQEALK